MTNNIVNLSVTTLQAPAPNTLQRKGALISQGGTTKVAGSLTLITQASDLTPILATPLGLSSLNWVTGVVTATATAAHNLTVSQVYYLTIAGAVPTSYNGTYACTITTSTQFTFNLASNPGAETSPGTWVSGTSTQLQQQVTTFFGMGAGVSVYVLELGLGSVNAGVAYLTTWLTNNLQTVYAILVPREWDNNASFLALIAAYEAPTALLYFWITTTISTYTSYTALEKSAMLWVEAPGIPATEFTIATGLWVLLNYNPGSGFKVPPYAFTYLYGVTPYPVVGNQVLFASLKAAGVNWVGLATEGGISKAIIYWGTYADGNPLNYWYATDWLQINLNLNLSNAIINGSNNSQNPLYLDQNGINTLQAVAAGTMASAITSGLLLGQVVQSELSSTAYAAALDAGNYAGQAVINAVPFATYYGVGGSPADFATGTYNGFSATVTPLRGFEQVTFYLTITNFIAL